MSTALLRKGLDLMSADVREKRQVGKNFTDQYSWKLYSASELMRVFFASTEEYWKKKAADHTEENLQYMLGSKFLTEDSVTQKVLMHSQGRKAKDRLEKEEVKKEEKSVFTDSEFRKFEREYFGPS
ncbi:active regulator of SIRT1 [Mustelus asterias]